jgi:hypothetical protein
MFMRHTGGGIGHSVVINSKYGTQDLGDIDAGNGCEHDGGDDGEGGEDEPYEEEDLDDEEEGGSDSEGDEEDELGPEDGEDGDWDDDNNEHGFADF